LESHFSPFKDPEAHPARLLVMAMHISLMGTFSFMQRFLCLLTMIEPASGVLQGIQACFTVELTFGPDAVLRSIEPDAMLRSTEFPV
jgi:hypothetical protein